MFFLLVNLWFVKFAPAYVNVQLLISEKEEEDEVKTVHS